ncbi:MAG: hypothetical protein OIF40_07255 [Mangrovicoccus sp.]|nr:hypothetical protein [Mangrovicoccus sp.]
MQHQDHSGPRGFADTGAARLLALALAIGLGWLAWTNWSTEIQGVFAPAPSALPGQSAPQIAQVNPALQACLDKRLGDVAQMFSDGVISETQRGDFARRAEAMCRAQNPG